MRGIASAFETSHLHDTSGASRRPDLLMQCRHCLRFSLGYCVKHGGKKPFWREPLYLRLADGRRFRLQFNCKECQMNLYAEN
jgi:protease